MDYRFINEMRGGKNTTKEEKFCITAGETYLLKGLKLISSLNSCYFMTFMVFKVFSQSNKKGLALTYAAIKNRKKLSLFCFLIYELKWHLQNKIFFIFHKTFLPPFSVVFLLLQLLFHS